jgi:hypothetical protein
MSNSLSVPEWEEEFQEKVEDLKILVYQRNYPPELVRDIMGISWNDQEAMIETINYFTDAEPPLNLCVGMNNEELRERVASYYLEHLSYQAGLRKKEPEFEEYYANVKHSAEPLQSEMMDFLRCKFGYMKQQSDFKTLKGWVRYNLEGFKEQFRENPALKEHFKLFPVAQRYLNFLKDIDKGRISIEEEDAHRHHLPKDPETSRLLKGLNEYRFDEYHEEKGFDLELLHRLIREKAGKEQLPYCIALMDETRFLEYLKKEFGKGIKANVHKLLAALFEVPEREIKGLWLVLTATSEEDRDRYTAHEYTETIKQQLKGHN